MNNEEKEKIEWLEEREQKLEEIERMIADMQYDINDNETIKDKNDIKMEIFKLFYYDRFNKKYDL